MSSTLRPLAGIGALLALALVAGPAHAGGIFLPGYGPQGQARAGAFIVKSSDVSAMAYNPAGLASTRGTMTQLGSNFVRMSLRFQRDGVYGPTGADEEPDYVGQPFPEVSDQSNPAIGFAGFQAIPLIGVATDLGRPELPLRVAAGIITPYGYPERRFTPDYEFEAEGVAPPPQRYDVMEQNAVKAGPTVAAAYTLADVLDLGARLTWGIAHIEATSYVWGVRNYEEHIGRDGYFQVSAWDYFVPNVGLGLRYRPTSSIEVAASYASAAHARTKGEGIAVLGSDLEVVPGQPDFIAPETDDWTCAPDGRLDALKTCVNFSLPQQAGGGARWIWRQAGEERADVEMNVVWENWSAGTASEYELIVDGKSGITGLPMREQVLRHNFQDVWSFRLGGSYAIPVAERRLIASAGAAYDTAAAPNDFQRLDVDGAARTTLGAGLAYLTPRLRVDFGAGAVLSPDRTVETCETSAAQPTCDGEHPDPIQPLRSRSSQFQNPINGGEYSSSYLLFSLGMTAWF
jgi:long-subunit fatty acid transport protein